MKRFVATLSALGLSLSALLAADTSQPVKEAAEKTTEATKKAAGKTVDAAKGAADKTADATKKAAGKTKEVAKDATDKTTDTTKKAAEKTTDAAKKGTAAAKEKATEAKEKAVEAKEKATGKPGELSASDKELVAHAQKTSATLTAAQKKSLLDLVNTGDAKAIEELPGVGEKKAANIISARPIKEVEDLIMVDGVGQVTFDGIVKHAGGSPESVTKDEKPAKAESKKPATKK